MGLEVYYKEDIRNAILAAKLAKDMAMRANGGDTYAGGYSAGYDAALEVILLAFGLVDSKESARTPWPAGMLALSQGR